MLPSFLLSSNQAYVKLRVGVKRHVCSAYIAKSKTRYKQKWVIQSNQDVQMCGIFLVDELLCMILLSSLFSLDGDYLSLLFFLTCHVGMWHTFFGYASLLYFFIFFTCLLSMWHTFFGYASFISSSSLFFFIALILDSHFREKESWYVMEFYFVGGWQCLLCEWMCTWSWSWEYVKSLTRVKEFDKTQSKGQTAYEGLSMKI